MDTEESSTVYHSAEHGDHLLEKNHMGSAQLYRDWLQSCTVSPRKTTLMSYKNELKTQWWCDSWCLGVFDSLVSEISIKHLYYIKFYFYFSSETTKFCLVFSFYKTWLLFGLVGAIHQDLNTSIKPPLIHVKALQHWDKPRSKGLTWVWTQKSNQKDAPSSSLPFPFITYTNPGVKRSHKTNELLAVW